MIFSVSYFLNLSEKQKKFFFALIQGEKEKRYKEKKGKRDEI